MKNQRKEYPEIEIEGTNLINKNTKDIIKKLDFKPDKVLYDNHLGRYLITRVRGFSPYDVEVFELWLTEETIFRRLFVSPKDHDGALLNKEPRYITNHYSEYKVHFDYITYRLVPEEKKEINYSLYGLFWEYTGI